MGTLARWAGIVAIGGILIAAPIEAQNPYLQPNESWIMIEGEVDRVLADRFLLDYGDGVVTVEMDDGDRDADAYRLLPGDRVSVHGRVDDDLFEGTTIEAGSIYVENLNTWFYSSTTDEEELVNWFPPAAELEGVTLQGIVTDVGDETFNINTGSREVQIGVAAMASNPLDDEGYLTVSLGDLVQVTGEVSRSLFEERILEANTVITLVHR